MKKDKDIDVLLWTRHKEYIYEEDGVKKIRDDASEEVKASYKKYQKLMVHIDDFEHRKDFKGFWFKKY